MHLLVYIICQAKQVCSDESRKDVFSDVMSVFKNNFEIKQIPFATSKCHKQPLQAENIEKIAFIIFVRHQVSNKKILLHFQLLFAFFSSQIK